MGKGSPRTGRTVPTFKGARGIGLPPLKKTIFHTNKSGVMSRFEEPVTFKEDEKFSVKEMKTAHSLIVISSVLLEKLDMFGVHNSRTEKIKEASKVLTNFCESMLHNVYGNSEKVANSTYIQELSRVLDEAIDDKFEIF